MSTAAPTRPRFFTIPEAAAEVRVSTKTIDRAIAAGALRAKLTTAKRGGRRLIRREWLDAWFDGLPDERVPDDD